MKSFFFQILAASAALCMMGACDGHRQGKPLSEIKDASSGDSLLYYFGQMHSIQYWHESTVDSVLSTPEGRSSYLRGLQAGLGSVGEDECYNSGLAAGMEMARNIKKFQAEYGVELDPDVLYESIAYNLTHDSIPNDERSSEHFYQILSAMKRQRDTSDRSSSETALKKIADTQKMEFVSPTLYRKTESRGSGVKLSEGETVHVESKFTCNGRPLAVPVPDEIKIGSTYINSTINEALLSMHEGEVASFMTTAYALFGRRCQNMHLNPSDLVSFKIITGGHRGKMTDANENSDGSQDTPTAL